MTQGQFELEEEEPRSCKSFPTVQKRSRHVNDLPLEISGHERKRELASVSRSFSMLAVHLKRSRECLLDVTVAFDNEILSTLLSAVFSPAHRWRSLHLLLVLSLRRACIGFFANFVPVRQVRYPDFLLPQHSPALEVEHLEMFANGLVTLDDLPAYSELKWLSIEDYRLSAHLLLSALLTSKNLTYLQLYALDPFPSAAPDSICLPSLVSVGVRGRSTLRVFDVIVAPWLTHFTFLGARECDLPRKFLMALGVTFISSRRTLGGDGPAYYRPVPRGLWMLWRRLSAVAPFDHRLSLWRMNGVARTGLDYGSNNKRLTNDRRYASSSSALIV
ncbi:hypothetical protein F5141DRAFT_1205698 [Pisolithus sp. B1]|nr:hypothetical protein F5141DRAFT_1205698 [Pisolithus sp. B1]